MIKGVIFDLDGVLVHTDKFHFMAWKALADKLGIYFDEKINNRLRGVSRMESLEIILERSKISYTAEEKEAFAAEKNEKYRDFLRTMTPDDVDKGVRETLEKLKRAGLKIAVGSSSKNAGLILAQTGLTDCFDAVSDGNGLKKSKPDPEVFLKAAAMLGLDGEECAVVEDAVAGIKAAKAAEMLSFAVGDAALSDEADFRMKSIEELPGIIAEVNE